MTDYDLQHFFELLRQQQQPIPDFRDLPTSEEVAQVVDQLESKQELFALSYLLVRKDVQKLLERQSSIYKLLVGGIGIGACTCVVGTINILRMFGAL